MHKRRKIKKTKKQILPGITFSIPEDYQLIVENFNEWLCIKDLKGYVIYLNPYAKEVAQSLMGRDLVGRHYTEFVAPESRTVVEAVLRQIRKGKNPKPFEIEVILKDKKRYPLLVTESVMRRDNKIVGSLGIAIDISEKRAKEAEIEWRMKEISALNAVAQVLNQPYDLDLILKNTLNKILEVTETEAGGICLLDEKRQELVLRVSRGLSQKIIAASTAIKVGEGISGKVAANNNPVVIEDLGRDRRLTRPLLLKEGFRSAAVVPIGLRGKAIGVFNILTRKPRKYSTSEINLLINIGNQIGIAVENSQLLMAREEEISRLHALNRISRIISSEISLDALLERVYEQVKAIIRPANFCITLYNDKTDAFDVILKYENNMKRKKYSFPADRGLSSKVFFSKKTILTNDYMDECKRQGVPPYGPPTKAWLGVPIVEKGKAIGCIYMYDYEEGDVFDKHDQELLTTIAGQTAVVVENVNQYKTLQQRVDELELLFEVGQSVVSVLDLDVVLDHIVNMLKRKFGHEKCAILLIDRETNELYMKCAAVPLTERLKKVRLKIGEQGVCGFVAHAGQTCYVPDIRRDNRYVEFAPSCRSEIAVPLKIGEHIIGVLNIEADVVDAFSEEDIRMLESVSNQASIAIENARLYESLEESYFNTIRTLVSAMEAKDAYTWGHSERVRMMALKIAEEIGLSSEEMKMINYAGYLHDIGKIGISDALLSKVEPLQNEEFDKIRLHPVIGHNMIKHLDFLTEVSRIIRHEHEKYDGSGYPDGLRGENIPLGARIIAVADAYDAMITDRPYRQALEHEEAIRRIKEAAGSQFDPKIVQVILSITEGDGKVAG